MKKIYSKKIFSEKGLISGKRFLALVLIVLLFFNMSIPVIAATSISVSNNSWTNKNSTGRILLRDSESGDEALFDASDLDMLAVEAVAVDSKVDRIDTALSNIETQLGIPDLSDVSSVCAGDVLLYPNSTIKSVTGNATLPEDNKFHGLLASSVNVDCSEATVIADNLTEGVKAYDATGNLIIGTGRDNETYYDRGVNDGSITILRAMYNSESIEQTYNESIVGGACSRAGAGGESASYSNNCSGSFPLIYQEGENIYVLNSIKVTCTSSSTAYGDSLNRASAGSGASISFFAADIDRNVISDSLGGCSIGSNTTKEGVIPMFEVNIPDGTEYIYFEGRVWGDTNNFGDPQASSSIGATTATYITLRR